MYFAYFDESGDDGFGDTPGPTFTLSGLLIHDKDWLAVLDELISYRGYLRDQFGIHSLAELKANWLLHRKGDFKNSPLSFDARMRVYRSAMRFQRKCGKIQTFAVVIHKNRCRSVPGAYPDPTHGRLRSSGWSGSEAMKARM